MTDLGTGHQLCRLQHAPQNKPESGCNLSPAMLDLTTLSRLDRLQSAAFNNSHEMVMNNVRESDSDQTSIKHKDNG